MSEANAIPGFEPSVDRPAGQSPLLEFKARLDEYVGVEREFKNDDGTTRKSTTVQFKFSEVDPIRTTEPYVFPIATISIPYAPPANSYGKNRWEALAASIRKLDITPPEGESQMSMLKGKMQHWNMQPATLRVQSPESKQYEDTEQDCWHVVAVEGVDKQGGGDIVAYVIELVNGKSESEFNEAALADPRIRNDQSVVKRITDRELLPNLVEVGSIKRSPEGIYSKA